LDNDSDPEGAPLAVTGVTQGADGTVTINPNSTVNYSPDPDFNGSDTFEYTVSEIFPATCQEVRDADPSASDGDYEIFPNGNAFTVYCHDMAGTPSDYLTLANTGGNFNFGQYTAGGAVPGTTVKTNYNRVRLDPVNMIINIGDQTFSSSVGGVNHGGPVTSMPYGVAMACVSSSNPAGRANVDLRGTPFFVDDTFTVGGYYGAGAATFSSGNQVVDVTGGGYCGWNTPSPYLYHPVNTSGGFRLNVGFNGPSAPTGLSATATVFVTVDPVNDQPSVAVVNSNVTVDEGQPAANNGTFDDIDTGDIVSITASVGTVSQVGTQSGTWNWAFTASDGPDDSQTVTITATDSDDAATDTSFDLVVNNVDPTVTSVDDATNPSGGIHSVSTSFTDPGVNDIHTATIDWGEGDGAESATVVEAGGNGTVSGSNQYFVPGDYTVTVTVTDNDGGSGVTTHVKTVVALPVAIDIKPGSDPNSINLGSKGVIPVGVFSGTYADLVFDASTIIDSSLEFEGAGIAHEASHPEDLDGAGALDSVSHYRTQETALAESSEEGCLTGQTTGGLYFEGCDNVRIVPPANNKPEGDDVGGNGGGNGKAKGK
jgi:hypothetical protein